MIVVSVSLGSLARSLLGPLTFWTAFVLTEMLKICLAFCFGLFNVSAFLQMAIITSIRYMSKLVLSYAKLTLSLVDFGCVWGCFLRQLKCSSKKIVKTSFTTATWSTSGVFVFFCVCCHHYLAFCWSKVGYLHLPQWVCFRLTLIISGYFQIIIHIKPP